MKITEQNITTLIREGKKEAYHFLYENYYRQLTLYAMTYIHEQMGAEDMVQNIFFKLWEGRNKLTVVANIKGYLYSAVRNECLNFLRHQNVKGRFQNEMADFLAKDEKTVENEYVIGELAIRIKEAIDSLPDKQKRIFLLSRRKNLKYAEIAIVLNTSEKNIEYHMSNALRYLRDYLKDYLPVGLIFLHQSLGSLPLEVFI